MSSCPPKNECSIPRPERRATTVPTPVRRSIASVLIFLSSGLALLACGPHFPNRYLADGNRSLATAPQVRFSEELTRLLPEATSFRAVVPGAGNDVYRQSDDVAADQLTAALTERGTPNVETIVARVREIRTRVAEARRERQQWQWRVGRGRDAGPPPIAPEVPTLPDALPSEFALYLRGAIAEARGETEEARTAWRALLDLDAERRKYRTVWAAYRLGRSFVDDDPAAAIDWFTRTRTFVEAGEIDGLGLAAASLGWEARAELNRGRTRAAARLYLEQWGSGDTRAIESLWLTGRTLSVGRATALEETAADPITRTLLTAYLIAKVGRFGREESIDTDPNAWLDALERVGTTDVRGASSFAVLAYRQGDWSTAQRWLNRAEGSSVNERWLQAKLWLIEGRVEEATSILASLCRAFEPVGASSDAADGTTVRLAERRRMRGELATLVLARRDYEESLGLLLRGGHWLDAAYVAERVLTTQELIAFVEAWPVPDAEAEKNARSGWVGSLLGSNPSEVQVATSLRALLGRRLAREGDAERAKKYLPPPLAEKWGTVHAALARGRDVSRTRADRAADLWRAAQIVRHDGIDLIGTEESPDWRALHGGNFEKTSLVEVRSEEGDEWWAPPSEEERARANATPVDPAKRLAEWIT